MRMSQPLKAGRHPSLFDVGRCLHDVFRKDAQVFMHRDQNIVGDKFFGLLFLLVRQRHLGRIDSIDFCRKFEQAIVDVGLQVLKRTVPFVVFGRTHNSNFKSRHLLATSPD